MATLIFVLFSTFSVWFGNAQSVNVQKQNVHFAASADSGNGGDEDIYSDEKK
jgi:hypothetical protein